MVDNDEYMYEVIENLSDAHTCAQLLAEEFAVHNVIAVFDQLTSQRFFNEVSWPILKDVLDEKLSFLARHRASGEIVGAYIACDHYLMYQKYLNKASTLPASIAVVDLFNELDDIFINQDFNQELKLNMVLHIVMGATRAQHSVKDVDSQLRLAMCKHARQTKGFEYALTQPINQDIRFIYLNEMNGKVLTVIDPTTWLWKKTGDESSYPYKEYTGGCIPNILIKLVSVENA